MFLATELIDIWAVGLANGLINEVDFVSMRGCSCPATNYAQHVASPINLPRLASSVRLELDEHPAFGLYLSVDVDLDLGLDLDVSLEQVLF